MFPRTLLIATACLCLGGTGRGSLDGLADGLAERIRGGLDSPRTRDVAVVVAAPWPRLATDLNGLLVARLRALGVRSVTRGEPDPAWARAAGFERLVRVEVELSAGKLRASGMVLALPSGLWGGEPEVRAHLFAEAALDDELRAYLPPAGTPPNAPVAWQARPLAIGDVALLALDVGDADGDGRPEIVGVTAGEVIAWGIEGGRAQERWRVRLDGRAAAERPRAELATVSVDDGALIAHASDFSDGMKRARGAQQAARGFSFPGLGGACERSPGVDWFAAESCGALAGLLPDKFWSAAGLRKGGARGGSLASAAVLPGGILWLRATSLAPLQVRGVGAQVALAALDRGDVVAASEPVEPGEPDALVIRAIAPGAPVVHRVDRLPGNVRAIAAGDVDGDGRVEIVAAVRDDAARKTELWLVN